MHTKDNTTPAVESKSSPAQHESPASHRHQFRIEGLNCASCVANVERALSEVDGVKSADVNLASSEARVEYKHSSSQVLVDAVVAAGYGAVPIDEMGREIAAPLREQPTGEKAMQPGSCCSSSGTGPRNGSGSSQAEGVGESRVDGSGGSQEQEAGSTGVDGSGVDGAGDSLINAPGGTRSGLAGTPSRFRRKFWIALPIAAVVFVMDMGPMAIASWHHALMPHLMFWNAAQMVLTAVVLFYAGSSFFTGAWRSARYRSADMNTLVAIGTGAAFAFSTYATFFGREGGLVTPMDVYFETAAIIVALILLGRWMEERARHRSRDAMTGLLELAPQTAHRIVGGERDDISTREANHQPNPGAVSASTREATHPSTPASTSLRTETIPVSRIVPGDRLLVKAWEQVPVDGSVVSGTASVDESMMTGESLPAERGPGEEVIGGTRNTSSAFEMQATRVGADTALARIIQTVRRAQDSKPPIQRLVDKVASVFVPVVLVIAVGTFVAWWLVGSPAQAMVNMVAVLVIACPCALGLATPTGLMVSSGRAAEKGILIKDAITLEQARRVDVVLFDKTGTLTSGEMQVQQVLAFDGAEKGLIERAAAVEQYSDHPLAKSIVRYAQQQEISMPMAMGVRTFAGVGISGDVGTHHVSIGAHSAHEAYTPEQQAFISEAQEHGQTVLLVWVDEQPAGFITIADTIRPGAPAVLAQLHDMGIETVMVTGDQLRNASVVAKELGIDRVEAGVKPDDKAALVQEYQKQGKCVAMVGDGINDAAALTQADLGMALSAGADLAISSSDITLVGGELHKVVEALALSRGTLRVIRQNLFWAFAYNSVGIPLAAAGLLSPVIAAFAMAMSSVSVVGNSLRIKRM